MNTPTDKYINLLERMKKAETSKDLERIKAEQQGLLRIGGIDWKGIKIIIKECLI